MVPGWDNRDPVDLRKATRSDIFRNSSIKVPDVEAKTVKRMGSADAYPNFEDCEENWDTST